MRTYPVIESLPYCCVPASLEAIFRRYGIDNISQVDIANYVGLTIRRNDIDAIPEEFSNIKYTENNLDLGMHLSNDTINDIFNHFDLPFKESYIPWNCISDFTFERALDNLKENEDLLLFFDFGTLYDESRNKGIGHCGIFIKKENERISYMNPGPRYLGVNSFKEDDFISAIKSRNGGISIIQYLPESAKI